MPPLSRPGRRRPRSGPAMNPIRRCRPGRCCRSACCLLIVRTPWLKIAPPRPALPPPAPPSVELPPASPRAVPPRSVRFFRVRAPVLVTSKRRIVVPAATASAMPLPPPGPSISIEPVISNADGPTRRPPTVESEIVPPFRVLAAKVISCKGASSRTLGESRARSPPEYRVRDSAIEASSIASAQGELAVVGCGAIVGRVDDDVDDGGDLIGADVHQARGEGVAEPAALIGRRGEGPIPRGDGRTSRRECHGRRQAAVVLERAEIGIGRADDAAGEAGIRADQIVAAGRAIGAASGEAGEVLNGGIGLEPRIELLIAADGRGPADEA